MRRAFATAAALGVVSSMLFAAPASADTCDEYLIDADPQTVTAAEFDQLRDGMTLQEVVALFGSEGEPLDEYETKTTKTLELSWNGAVTLLDLYGDETTPEIDVTFSRTNATTATTYQRKRVKVKNVKRAKRLGLPRFRWRSVRVVSEVPATPYTVMDFDVYDEDILRQTFELECESDGGFDTEE